MNLLPSEYLEYVLTLGLSGPVTDRPSGHGHHRSAHSGGGIEFQDFRAYAPGDDLRRIDRNLYERHGKLFIRRYHHFQPAEFGVILDNSPSMHFEGSRRVAAIQTAAAIAAILLNHHNRVTVFVTGGNEPCRFRHGHHDLPVICEYLTGFSRPTSGGDWSQPLAGPVPRINWLISDFFTEAGIDAALERLRQTCGRIIPVRIFRRHDREPELSGDLRLEDCESTQRLELSVTPDLLKKYRDGYDRFTAAIDRFSAVVNTCHYAIDADQTMYERLETLTPQGVLNLY